MAIYTSTLPETGFVRLAHLVGQTSKGYKKESRQDIQGLLPISRSQFLRKVKSGEYPQPVKLGPRTVAWRAEDIKELLARLGA